MYADSGMGYNALFENADKMYKKTPNMQMVIVGQDIQLKKSMMLNSIGLKEYRERNSPGNFNHVMIGNVCVVLIYQLWEEHYRERIASLLQKDKNDLKADSIGDIRNMRNDIIHHNFRVSEKTKNNKVFTFFKDKTMVQITNREFNIIMTRLKADIKAFIPVPPPTRN
ncbi:MAG: hypothetical protein JNM78_10475 [Cyclobacteriaceae bacterium]|nr:hypothetical protein [Cyclobacteriaceae bacterium]